MRLNRRAIVVRASHSPYVPIVPGQQQFPDVPADGAGRMVVL